MVISILCAALGIAAPAAEPPEQSPGVLEEIVVTAQRREEDLMRVPLAVSVITGTQLEAAGALDISWLSQVTPNVSIEPARGTNNALSAYIRGVGQQDHIAGFESGVGLYVDDVYFNRPQLALLEVYDVERIEILRGPQGTLYGRNSVGGAIKYVTRRPAEAPEFRVRGRAGTHGMADVILSGTAPLGPSLRLGGSLAGLNLDGFGENRVIAGEQNYNKRITAARVTAEWEASDKWSLRITGDRLEDDSDLRRGHRLLPGGYSGAPVLADVYDTRAGNRVPAADAEAWGLSALVEWAVHDALTWRLIMAHREDETWKPVDLDGLPTVDVDVSTWDGNRQDTVELQALVETADWQGVMGLFAIDAFAGTDLDALLGTLSPPNGPQGFTNQLQAFVDTRSWSAYADFSRELGADWLLSLGGRYTHDRRSSQIYRNVLFGGLSSFFGGQGRVAATVSDFDGSAVFQEFTPRASLQWQRSERQSLYVTYSEGFKGGGFDPRGLSSTAPDMDQDGEVSGAEIHEFMLFQPEQLRSLEFGWKATLAGGRVFSRLALFHAIHSDVQIPGAVGVDEDGDGFNEQYIGITTNAARAEFRGLEWEGSALLANDFAVPALRLDMSWSLGWIDARWKAFIDGTGADVAGVNRLANTPEWTAAVTVNGSVPVRWFGVPARFGLVSTLSWRDDQSQFERPIPLFDQPAYLLWDLGFSWTDQAGRLQCGLFARNLGDERYIVSGLDIDLGLERNYTAYYGNPRQLWLDLAYRFR